MLEFGILVALAPFVMVIAIVGLVQAGRTARHWMDWRMRMAERQLELGSPTVRAAIEEFRQEIAALKQHETDAVFSFDSSLERLEARMAHLEQRAIPVTPARAPLTTTAARSADPAALSTAQAPQQVIHNAAEPPIP